MRERLLVGALLPLLAIGCGGGDAGEARRERPPPTYAALQASVERLRFRFPEATDTAVRDSVLVAFYCSVVHAHPVPEGYGMFSPDGDHAVRAVVVDHVARARAATRGLTDAERIDALWGDSWRRDVFLRRRDCPIG